MVSLRLRVLLAWTSSSASFFFAGASQQPEGVLFSVVDRESDATAELAMLGLRRCGLTSEYFADFRCSALLGTCCSELRLIERDPPRCSFWAGAALAPPAPAVERLASPSTCEAALPSCFLPLATLETILCIDTVAEVSVFGWPDGGSAVAWTGVAFVEGMAEDTFEEAPSCSDSRTKAKVVIDYR